MKSHLFTINLGKNYRVYLTRETGSGFKIFNYVVWSKVLLHFCIYLTKIILAVDRLN